MKSPLLEDMLSSDMRVFLYTNLNLIKFHYKYQRARLKKKVVKKSDCCKE